MASKNAINQALKKLTGKRDVRALLGIPRTRLTSARYVEESYNILPWFRRTDEEKSQALATARRILDGTK